MTQPTTEQIIDAVIGGHPNIGTWLGREITAEAIRRASMHRADTASPTITPTPANAASGQDGAQTALPRDTVDGGYPFDGKSRLPDGTPVTHPDQLIDRSPLTPDEIGYGLAVAARCENSELPNLAERGVREAVSVKADDAENESELAMVSAERDALSVLDGETVPPTSETTPPRETHGQTDSRPRPKGMTKLRTKVWDWIEEHSGPNHNADNLSVNKVKAGAGCARGVAGEMLALYRSWYTDTSQKSA